MIKLMTVESVNSFAIKEAVVSCLLPPEHKAACLAKNNKSESS